MQLQWDIYDFVTGWPPETHQPHRRQFGDVGRASPPSIIQLVTSPNCSISVLGSVAHSTKCYNQRYARKRCVYTSIVEVSWIQWNLYV